MSGFPELSHVPFLGTINEVDPSATHKSYSRLAEIHGEVFGFYMATQHTIVVNSHRIYDELCDEKKFEKRPVGALLETRNFLGDGLFTAYPDEENWALAHRILMPKFGPVSGLSRADALHPDARSLTTWICRLPSRRCLKVSRCTRSSDIRC